MTKFKFGDKVWHKEYGLCVVTGSSPLKAHSIAHNHYARAQIPWFIDEDDLTPVTDWVKCSERLPKHGEMVLVFNGNSIEIDALAIGEFDFECWCDSVTHWMPLPEMPEVKE